MLLTGILTPGHPTLWLAVVVIASLVVSEVLTTNEHLTEALDRLHEGKVRYRGVLKNDFSARITKSGL